MLEAQVLRERWSPERSERIQARLVAGLPLDELGLDRVGGRLDLRGIAFSSSRWQALYLRDLDLTAATLADVRMSAVVLTNCVLDGVAGRSLTMTGGRVSDTSFRDAGLDGAHLAGEFTRVDLTGARLSSARLRDMVCVDGDFSGAELAGVSLVQSGLRECRFAGVVSRVAFDGWGEPHPQEHLDLTGAVLDRCLFAGVRFATIALPDDPDLILVRDRATADELLADAPPIIARDVRKQLDRHGTALLNLRDLRKPR